MIWSLTARPNHIVSKHTRTNNILESLYDSVSLTRAGNASFSLIIFLPLFRGQNHYRKETLFSLGLRPAPSTVESKYFSIGPVGAIITL